MVALALSLWNGNHKVNLWTTLGAVDGDWGQRALEALAIYTRYGSLQRTDWQIP